MKHVAVPFASADLEPAFAPRISGEDQLPPVDDRLHDGPRDFDGLYRDQAPRLLRFFSGRASKDEATDLVNETFARLLGIERRISGAVERPAAYLTRIATNLLKDRARVARRTGDHLSFDETVHGGSDASATLDDREALDRLNQAVGRLRPRTRQIFLLHRVEGLTYAQIADEEGMSVKGVKKQMAKALFELRREMGAI